MRYWLCVLAGRRPDTAAVPLPPDSGAFDAQRVADIKLLASQLLGQHGLEQRARAGRPRSIVRVLALKHGGALSGLPGLLACLPAIQV